MTDQLRVNMIRCSAHGMCAEILPERVTLDDWGYPIVDGEPVGPELTALAKRAVAACPVFALSLQRQRAAARRSGALRSGAGGHDGRHPLAQHRS